MAEIPTPDKREVIHGLSLDVDIIARELYAMPGSAGGDAAVQAIDRMLDSLRRLRAELAAAQDTEAGDG